MSEPAGIDAGLPVFSNDGDHLGHVEVVDAGAGWFKVNTPQAPDFWLPLVDVQEVRPQHVLLRISRERVRTRKWEGPQPELPTLSAIGTDRDPDATDR